jgi:hypothetical protein
MCKIVYKLELNNWTTLSARFTADEVAIIKRLEKQFNINDSRFVRNSVLFGTMMYLILDQILSQPASIMTELYPVLKEIYERKEKRHLDKIMKGNPKLVERVNQELKVITSGMDVFQAHRKRGAPKKPKRKRGRPRDTGL